MKRTLLKSLFCFIISTLFFINCQKAKSEQTAAEQSKQDNYQELSVQEVNSLLQSSEDVLLIDVRTTEEYNGHLGHIAGSTLKPVQQIDNWIGEIDKDTAQTIVFICRSGNRSGRAAQFFQEKGYSNLINMTGGMLAWNKANLPTEKDE